MQTKRQIQIGDLLKKEIGQIVSTRLDDPKLGFITITNVLLSKDTRNAKVYFSVIGDLKQQKSSLESLTRARIIIQNELRHRVRLKYLPVLHFYYDDVWDQTIRVENLLHNLKSDKNSSLEN